MDPIRDARFMERLRVRNEIEVEHRAAFDDNLWAQYGITCAVMLTDMSGFSRATAEHGIIHFLGFIERKIRLSLPHIEGAQGRLIKTIGDDLFCVFPHPDQALHAAFSMRKAIHDDNCLRPKDERFDIGIGLGFGQILSLGGEDFFGDEVNRASKLGEDLAGAGQILVTPSFKNATSHAPGYRFEPRQVHISGVSLPHFECIEDVS